MNDREKGIVLFALEFLKANLDDEVDEIFLESEFTVGDYPATEEEIASLMSAVEYPVSLPIVVVLEGGRVRNAMSNVPVGVTVIDYERDGIPEDKLCEVPQESGEMALAEVYDANVDLLNSHWQGFVDWWEENA